MSTSKGLAVLVLLTVFDWRSFGIQDHSCSNFLFQVPFSLYRSFHSSSCASGLSREDLDSRFWRKEGLPESDSDVVLRTVIHGLVHLEWTKSFYNSFFRSVHYIAGDIDPETQHLTQSWHDDKERWKNWLSDFVTWGQKGFWVMRTFSAPSSYTSRHPKPATWLLRQFFQASSSAVKPCAIMWSFHSSSVLVMIIECNVSLFAGPCEHWERREQKLEEVCSFAAYQP